MAGILLTRRWAGRGGGRGGIGGGRRGGGEGGGGGGGAKRLHGVGEGSTEGVQVEWEMRHLTPC